MRRHIHSILLAAVLVLVACAPVAPDVAGLERVRVSRVIEGDTVVVRLAGADETVRLYAVDTPETKGGRAEPFGEEASAFAERQLAGRDVWLEVGEERRRDRYDRLLAYVWLEPPATGTEGEIRTRLFNALLLEGGYAEVYRDSQDRTYMELFFRLEAEARDAGRGMWAR